MKQQTPQQVKPFSNNPIWHDGQFPPRIPLLTTITLFLSTCGAACGCWTVTEIFGCAGGIIYGAGLQLIIGGPPDACTYGGGWAPPYGENDIGCKNWFCVSLKKKYSQVSTRYNLKSYIVLPESKWSGAVAPWGVGSFNFS